MTEYLLTPTQIFSLFFVMMGPFEKLIPFMKATRSLNNPEIKVLSLKSMALSTASLIVGGFLGCKLLEEWSIQVPVLEFTSGIIFTIKAFTMIFLPQEKVQASADGKVESTNIAYSVVMNPWGMAALVGLLASSRDNTRTLTIIGILLFVLVLDLLAMLFIRHLTGKVGIMVLRFVSTVFIVLQAALGVNLAFLSYQLIEFKF